MKTVFVVTKYESKFYETSVVMAFSDEQMAIDYCEEQNAAVRGHDHAKTFIEQDVLPFSYECIGLI